PQGPQEGAQARLRPQAGGDAGRQPPRPRQALRQPAARARLHRSGGGRRAAPRPSRPRAAARTRQLPHGRQGAPVERPGLGHRKGMTMNFQGFFDSVPDALFFTLHGSRLFGVEGPESDWDVKGVRLPPARDLLLGDRKALAPLEHKLDNGEAAVHALQHFLDMLEKADTNAIDMLFAARSERGLLA